MTRHHTTRLRELMALLLFCALPLYGQVPTNGLQLWLKADTLSLNNGDPVAFWPDASGGARHATSAGPERPLFVASALNGKPVIRFVGTTGFSSRGSAMLAPVATGQNVTAIVVIANNRSTLVREAVDVILASKTSGDPSQFTGFGFSTYNGFASMSTRQLISEASGTTSFIRLRKNGTNGPVTLAPNEYAIATYLGTGIINLGTVNGRAAGSELRIGSFVGETEGLYGANDIAEILVYNRVLPSTEVVAIEQYLSQKYAIAAQTTPLPPPGGTKPWRGAEYRTKESYLYGRFEVRMRSVPGSGVLSTFFTYHDFVGSTQQWNEIDVEILGRYNNEVQFNVITAGEVSHVHRHVVNFNPHQAFHDYAFEWTEDEVRWFIDGVQVYMQNQSHIRTLTRSQKIMMNIWQPIWTDWTGPFDWQILPLYPQYDYVRYYALARGRGNAGTDNNFLLMWEDNFDSYDSQRWDRGTHTWDGNNSLFVPENIFFREGKLFLGLTLPEQVGELLSVRKTAQTRPEGFLLEANYPNPFNPSTTIAFSLPEASRVTLDVFDLNGRKVASLVDARYAQGRYEVRFRAPELASGVYLYRINAQGQGGRFFTDTRKMLLIK